MNGQETTEHLRWSLQAMSGELPRPRDRVPREHIQADGSSALKPKERWQRALRIVMRDYVQISRFSYSRIQKDEIRLLCLHPGHAQDPLKAYLFKRKLVDVKDGYEALSYCWGSPNERNTHGILIRDLNAGLPGEMSDIGKFRITPAKAMQETRFHIRKNLHQALLKLRNKEEQIFLWVDAICIDQTDNGKEEKENQLSLMASIYNSASNVCIWLGDTQGGAAEGIRLVQDIMNFKDYGNLISVPKIRDRYADLISLMNASWFGRRWVIQEVALSKNATVHCADHIVHWDDFANAIAILTEGVEQLKKEFRDETFEDLENNRACVLIRTLSNSSRKSGQGDILGKTLDMETLVSTLLGFKASFPRDTIYAILSLAQDPPQANEKWEMLHSSQLEKVRMRTFREFQTVPKRAISLTPNYDLSTRDVFIAFVTRCIERSGCLDIICRHWAPQVLDRIHHEVAMPSWVFGISKSPYGIPGPSQGRQNGENFVAYSPNDQRKKYSASGSYQAQFRMVDDTSLTLVELNGHGEQLYSGTGDTLPIKSSLSSSRLDEDLPTIQERPPSQNGSRDAKLASDAEHLSKDIAAFVPQSETLTPIGNGSRPVISRVKVNANTSPGSQLRNPNPSTKIRVSRDVERQHRLSGIMAAKGFVLCTIRKHSQVMRGGVVPGDWVDKLAWDREHNQIRDPDTLWRLLVANRTRAGEKLPQWYQRAYLYGLGDPRITDEDRNLHSVISEDRKISEYTRSYFERVQNVVWNRRLVEAESMEGFEGPMFGIVGEECGVGDIICIFLGCSVPVVLKRVEKFHSLLTYKIVGEAFIHGMMDGEAVQDENMVDKLAHEFTLI